MSTLDAEHLGPTDVPPPAPEPQPKRGPGRPRKDGLPPGSVPPNRDSTSGTKRRGRPKANREIRESMSVLIGSANLALSFTRYREDCLSNDEMDLLTDALVAEVSASERIGGWLGKAAAMSPHILLIQAVIRIALPRLQRHGLLPAPPALPPELQRELEEMAARGASASEIQERYRQYVESVRNGSAAESPVSMASR